MSELGHRLRRTHLVLAHISARTQTPLRDYKGRIVNKAPFPSFAAYALRRALESRLWIVLKRIGYAVRPSR